MQSIGNRFAAVLLLSTSCLAQQTVAPFKTQQINSSFYVGFGTYASIQQAVTAACATPGATVIVPAGTTPPDTITTVSGCLAAGVIDFRVLPSASYKWSGAIYVLQASTSTPAGTTGAMQWNNGGVFGGLNGSGLVKLNGAGAPTVIPGTANITGVVGSITFPTSLPLATGIFTSGHLRFSDGNLNEADSGMDLSVVARRDVANTFSGINTFNGLNNYFAGSVAGLGTVSNPSYFTAGIVTTATAGANRNSGTFQLQGFFWNGTSSVQDVWNIRDILGAGTNPTSTLTITNATSPVSPGRKAVSVPGLVMGFSGYVNDITGTGTRIVSSTSSSTFSGNVATWNGTGDVIDSGVVLSGLALLANNQTWTGTNIFNDLTANTTLKLTSATTATSAVIGAATALPAQPLGYLVLSVNGTLVKLPYYGN